MIISLFFSLSLRAPCKVADEEPEQREWSMLIVLPLAGARARWWTRSRRGRDK